MKKKWAVQEEAWINGKFQQAGSTLYLSDEEAKYYAEPYGTVLAAAPEAKKPARAAGEGDKGAK